MDILQNVSVLSTVSGKMLQSRAHTETCAHSLPVEEQNRLGFCELPGMDIPWWKDFIATPAMSSKDIGFRNRINPAVLFHTRS
jgi:hypothetical protein